MLPEFVTTNVYVFPLPLNVPLLPFVTCTSSFVNPVTFSLNVNVYVILLAFVGDDLFAVTFTVGAVVSSFGTFTCFVDTFPALSTTL